MTPAPDLKAARPRRRSSRRPRRPKLAVPAPAAKPSPPAPESIEEPPAPAPPAPRGGRKGPRLREPAARARTRRPRTQAKLFGLEPMQIAALGGGVLLLVVLVVMLMRRRRLPNDLDVTALVDEDAEPASITEGLDFGAGEREAAPAAPAPPRSAPERPTPAQAPTPPIAAPGGLFGDTDQDLFDTSEKGENKMSQDTLDLPVSRSQRPTPAPTMATSAAGDSDVARLVRELERRMAQVETRLDEANDARERLERQVAAQSEELRVQRAAIARTQRALRGTEPRRRGAGHRARAARSQPPDGWELVRRRRDRASSGAEHPERPARSGAAALLPRPCSAVARQLRPAISSAPSAPANSPSRRKTASRPSVAHKPRRISTSAGFRAQRRAAEHDPLHADGERERSADQPDVLADQPEQRVRQVARRRRCVPRGVGELRERGRREIARKREIPRAVDVGDEQVDAAAIALAGEGDQALEIGDAGERGAEPQQGAPAQRGAAHPRHLGPIDQHGRGPRPEGNEQVALAGREALPGQQGLGAGAPGVELVHGRGVQREAARQRDGAAAGQPDPVGRETLNFEGQPFDVVGWDESIVDPPLPPRDGELRERGPDVDAESDPGAVPGRGRGPGLRGNRHWNQLVRLRSVVD